MRVSGHFGHARVGVGGWSSTSSSVIGQAAKQNAWEGFFEFFALKVLHHHHVVQGDLSADCHRCLDDRRPGLTRRRFQAQIGVDGDFLDLQNFTRYLGRCGSLDRGDEGRSNKQANGQQGFEFHGDFLQFSFDKHSAKRVRWRLQ